jgi:hypothetical protein
MIDLSPARAPEDLIDALYEARRGERKDLRSQVERLVDHEEPIVRQEALMLLLAKWKCGDLRDKARALMQGDEDSGVRSTAALGLASISQAPHRLDDARLLAQTYADKTSALGLRLACFEALMMMVGRPTVAELDDTDLKQVDALVDEIARR